MSDNGEIDFAKSLDELQRVQPADLDSAPTSLVKDVILSRRKPLRELTPEEIARLIVQRDGLPFMLDRVFPLLEADPLFDGGYYPVDVLSNLIRAQDDMWRDRPHYRAMLPELYARALSRSPDEKDAFLESLGIEGTSAPN